jgi:Replication-relaxation
MPAVALKPAGAPLPKIAGEVLTSLYQHRLLTTTQVHAMHMPTHGRRWAEQVLAQLAHRELVAFVRVGRGAPRLYFLTQTGAEAVEDIPTRVETRRKLITPEQATGPLRAHTLAVNETGIAFMAAAHAREDEFGPLSWRHEIAHPVAAPAGYGRGELLIADALLTYLAHGPTGALTFHYRLLELDRGTVPADILASKLARYARLYQYTGRRQPTDQPVWRERYPIFPETICVLADKPRAVLERRAQTVLALCREDPQLQATPEVRISLALLKDLQAHGPFAAIWRTPNHPQRALDWLGQPQTHKE